MERIVSTINKATNVAIFVHRKPDPDAVGSAFGMYFMLRKLNKSAKIILEEPLGDNLNVFPEVKDVRYSANPKNFDLFLALDCGSPVMLNKYENTFKLFPNTICIDHHATRNIVSKYDFVNSKCCSTTEVLYDLCKFLNLKIDADMATALYMGIVGDTGRFMHNNTTADTLCTASKLVAAGANIQLINDKLYKSNSVEKLTLMQILLSKMQIVDNIVFCSLTLYDYGKAHCKPSESYELIDILNSVKNANVAILFNEIKNDVVNVSFRSTNNIDVSYIASKFGGGGHKQAAGIKEIMQPIERVQESILNVTRKYLKDQNG